uniref:Angiopoietin like 4 n=1 Tax=Neogobius melanostomus TaxID=47308 RepID=A0A8C6TP11_9GOBI
MTTTTSAVVLLTALLTANGYPTTGGRGDRQQQQQHASWDDVNVVAHGLLQLGQALREHVGKSKAQMRELNAGLRSLNATLQRLEEQRGDSSQRGTAARGLGEDDQVWDSRVEELRQRMDRLEQRVDEVVRKPALDILHLLLVHLPPLLLLQILYCCCSLIQMMAAQNRRIDQLLEKIKQQQDKLEKQSVHLQALQKQKKKKRQVFRVYDFHNSWHHCHGYACFAKDCHELFVQGQRKSGVYTVQPENSQTPFSVLCEMTPGGGWTVIQKRSDGSQSFDQTWDSYRKGFGSLNGEFWLGLDHIHALSSQGRCVLQMELSDRSGESHVTSSEFRLDGEERQFSLHLSPETGSSGSSALPFSTADRDNDLSAGEHCAQIHSGGWWFGGCGDSNLNGDFPSGRGGSRDMFWTTSEGHRTALRSTVIKIAPVSTQQ